MVANARRSVERNSYADYQQWPDDQRFEIIDGIAYAMNAPFRVHQEVSGELFLQFGNYLKGKPCKVYAAPFDVRLPDRSKLDSRIFNVIQPDITIVCDKNKLDDRGCIGAPDMVIEILSPSSLSYDNVKKRSLYEKYGVKEFWLVHPTDRVVHAYHLVNGSYGKPDFFDLSMPAVPTLFPDLKIDLCEVFGVPPVTPTVKEEYFTWPVTEEISSAKKPAVARVRKKPAGVSSKAKARTSAGTQKCR